MAGLVAGAVVVGGVVVDASSLARDDDASRQQGSATDEAFEIGEAPAAGEPGTVELVDYGLTAVYCDPCESWIVSWVASIQNTDTSRWSGQRNVEVYYLRDDGSVIESKSHTTGLVPPGETVPDHDETFLDERPADVAFDMDDAVFLEGPPAAAYVPFVTEGIHRDDDTIGGQIRNPYPGDADVRVIVVVRRSERIVWGGSTIVGVVRSGEASPWSVTADYAIPEGDIEVVAVDRRATDWPSLADTG